MGKAGRGSREMLRPVVGESPALELRNTTMLIGIDMLDAYRSLGAGRHIVKYVGFRKGRLLCRDMMDSPVRLPLARCRFVRAIRRETRSADKGIEVKGDEEWRELEDLPADDVD